MEIGTDTTARIAADILMAALESKAVTTRDDTKESVQQIAEAFHPSCRLGCSKRYAVLR